MSFSNYLSFLQKILEHFPFTVLDLVFFVCLVVFVVSEKRRGIMQSGLTLILTFIVLILTLLIYDFVSIFLQKSLSFSKGISDGLGFVIISTLFAGLFFVNYKLILLNISPELSEKRAPYGSMLLGLGTFYIAAGMLFTTLLSFPITEVVKSKINESYTMSKLTVHMQSLEGFERRLFGQTSYSLMNFFTIDPTQKEEVVIKEFTNSSESPDQAKMLVEQINTMRKDKGLHEFEHTEDVSRVATILASEISNNQIFSQSSINGITPFDILSRSEVNYSAGYFIPIISQNVKLAYNGLLQTSIYSEQILSARYSKIGVGSVWLKENGYLYTIVLIN